MMTKELMKMIHKSAIEEYGMDNQVIVTIEELSELQKELTKILRDEGSISRLIEEMADVEIMLSQVKEMFALKDEDLEKMKIKKTARLLDRLLKDRKV
jgi:chorismate-pyruvate lyase